MLYMHFSNCIKMYLKKYEMGAHCFLSVSKALYKRPYRIACSSYATGYIIMKPLPLVRATCRVHETLRIGLITSSRSAVRSASLALPLR